MTIEEAPQISELTQALGALLAFKESFDKQFGISSAVASAIRASVARQSEQDVEDENHGQNAEVEALLGG
ncbi:MAG TPA: hypothetical protein VIT68_01820, partial [Candidatus Gracilibacteria bacterium]